MLNTKKEIKCIAIESHLKSCKSSHKWIDKANYGILKISSPVPRLVQNFDEIEKER